MRIRYLDSVRGIAAFVVIIYHFIGWRWGETLNYKLASMVFNGSDAVSLFFVLSGLVLSWKYFEPDTSLPIDGLHYRRYVVNRVVRLYIPFLVALAGYYLYNHRHDALGQLVKDFAFNTHHWAEEALLLRGKHDLYIPAWTLEVELGISLLVPFLVLLLRYSRPLFGYLLLISLLLGPPFITWGVFHFGLGMGLTYYFRRIAAAETRQARWYPYRFLLYAMVLALFSLRHILRIYPLGELGNYWMGMFRLDIFHFTGAAAALLLAYVINSPRLQQVLESRPLLFLGRISYSVYLLHWFFVVYVMDHWDKLAAHFASAPVAFGVLLLATVGATLAAGTVFNILVERPAIRLGRQLAGRVGHRPTLVSATPAA